MSASWTRFSSSSLPVCRQQQKMSAHYFSATSAKYLACTTCSRVLTSLCAACPNPGTAAGSATFQHLELQDHLLSSSQNDSWLCDDMQRLQGQLEMPLPTAASARIGTAAATSRSGGGSARWFLALLA